MSAWKKSTKAALAATVGLLNGHLVELSNSSFVAQAAENCAVTSDPVVSLGLGSRYTADSKTRSDLDEAANTAVNDALKPIDKFIQDISRDANSAQIDPGKQQSKSNCVLSAIHAWAKADALRDMQTMNARIAIPSRIGGIAVAYRQVRDLAPNSASEKKVIEDWLKRLAVQTTSYFDTEAPKNASRNNLRAWASFAVGEIGIITQDATLANWSLDSNKTMIAQSSPDGSLPLEMGRAKYALHYQLHAVTALFYSIARLCDAGYGDGGIDIEQMRRIAHFSVNGVKNPEIVAAIAGQPQKFDTELKEISSSLVWLEPYRSLTGEELMKLDMLEIRPLMNSKLGGDITRMFSARKISCDPKAPIAGN